VANGYAGHALGSVRCPNRLSNAALARRSFRRSRLPSPRRRPFPRTTAHSPYGPSIPQADYSFPSAPSIPGHVTFVGMPLRRGMLARGSMEGTLFGPRSPLRPGELRRTIPTGGLWSGARLGFVATEAAEQADAADEAQGGTRMAS
jgi:hypothetical protein